MGLIKQLIKFGITGIICFVIDFVIYVIIINLFKMFYIIAGAVSFIISTVVNYYLSSRFVFEMDNNHPTRNLIIFWLLSVSSLLFHELILYIFGTLVFHDEHYMLSKILTTGVVMCYNFITRKLILDKGVK